MLFNHVSILIADKYEFGTRLLNLCKSTGRRIVNGRHKEGGGGGGEGQTNQYTYNDPRGLSVIDYLLCHLSMVSLFIKIIVCDFNEFSYHAPVHVDVNGKV